MGGPNVGDGGRGTDDVHVLRFEGDVRVDAHGNITEGDGRPLTGLGPDTPPADGDAILALLRPGEVAWAEGAQVFFYRTTGGERGMVNPVTGQRTILGAGQRGAGIAFSGPVGEVRRLLVG